jgi:transposase-like protein
LPAGRPTKLTDDIQKRIVDAIMRGAYIETAAQANGINKSTFYDWLKTGRRLLDLVEKGETISGKKNLALMEFSNAVEKAIGASELKDVGVIDTAGNNGVWQAAAWRLERKHHVRWGRKLALTDADGGSIAENAASAWAKALKQPVPDDQDKGNG